MTATRIMASLGWRWRRVRGSPQAHLVPKAPGRLSRTACNRLPVPDPADLETPAGLLTDAPLCQSCARAER